MTLTDKQIKDAKEELGDQLDEMLNQDAKKEDENILFLKTVIKLNDNNPSGYDFEDITPEGNLYDIEFEKGTVWDKKALEKQKYPIDDWLKQGACKIFEPKLDIKKHEIKNITYTNNKFWDTEKKHWEEIDELPKILEAEIYIDYSKGKETFKAPFLAGDIIFNSYRIDLLTGNSDVFINRGWLVTKDDKKIWRYNGKHFEDDGEEIARDIVQQVLGSKCKTHYKNEVINWIIDNTELHIDRKDLDNEINYIGVKNGVVNLETGELQRHEPYHMITSVLPTNYDPDAKCPTFNKFLEDILYTEDIPFIQEICGYCLYRRYVWAILVILVGIGRNGKSTLINVLTKMLGENNVSHVPLQQLAKERFAKADLYRKWANLCADLSDEELKQTGMIKQLTGGDSIYAEHKGEPGFHFTNFAKLMFACNLLPECKDKTKAMEERLSVIEFPNSFPRDSPDCDPFILDKLTTEKELSGIFNWAIEGLKRLRQNNNFSKYRNLEEVNQYLRVTKNSVYQFVEQCIIKDSNGEETKDDVYKSFLIFAESNDYPSMASNQFSMKFKEYTTYFLKESELGEGQSRLKGRKKTWKGIRLKDKKNTNLEGIVEKIKEDDSNDEVKVDDGKIVWGKKKATDKQRKKKKPKTLKGVNDVNDK